MSSGERSDQNLRQLYQRAVAEAAAPRAVSAGVHPDEVSWERLLCEEVTDEERQNLLDHILACPDCAEIYRVLLAVRHEAAAVDPGAPVVQPPERVVPFWRRRPERATGRWAAYAVAAGLVLMAGLAPFLWRAWQAAPAIPPPDPGRVPAASASSKAAPPALRDHPAFQLDKAPVMLSASLALTPRGSADERQRFLDALGEALAPYRGDDYPQAAQRLERLSRAYPDAVEPALYAGVALLLSGRAADAVPLLERARAKAPPEFHEEIDWRLSLAYVHVGLSDQARASLQRVCSGTGAYRDRACAALAVLGARR